MGLGSSHHGHLGLVAFGHLGLHYHTNQKANEMTNGNIEAIAFWQRDTFGHAHQCLKLHRSMLEVAEAIAVQSSPRLFVGELADIWITLTGPAVAVGCTNEGVQKVMNQNLTGSTPIPTTEIAVATVCDTIVQWQTIELQKEFREGYEEPKDDTTILGYQCFWNLVQAARSSGVSETDGRISRTVTCWRW